MATIHDLAASRQAPLQYDATYGDLGGIAGPRPRTAKPCAQDASAP